jgi:glycosyltransferase involved in cell wall biosynthesis
MTTMFKNEASVVRRMLESCYKHIDFWVVQDNGSTDGTDKIVKDFFEEKKIPGYYYQVEEGWVGFGWNRDHLTRTCQSIDHGCDWILKMDCDETLEVDDDFDWSLLDDKTQQSFHIPAVQDNCVYYRAWMWNANMPWRFNHDPCHETIYCEIDGIGENFNRCNLPLSFRQVGSTEGQSWSVPTKFISDALILEEKLIRENTMLSDMYHFWYIGKSQDVRATIPKVLKHSFLWIFDEEKQDAFNMKSNDEALDMKLLQMFRLYNKSVSASLFAEINVEN